MQMSRDELRTLIAQLADRLPELIQEHPDPADFWPAFAGLADVIEDSAAPDDARWASDAVLGLIAAHDVPSPL